MAVYKEQQKQFVEFMAKEIIYICNEAVEHNNSWKEFKASVFRRIVIEGKINNLMKGANNAESFNMV